MQKLLKWLDENIISLLAGFLLIFIPLYPKLPLVDILPGYIVRVRLEDFIVSFTILIWLIWLLRGKVEVFKNPLFKLISAYLIAGILSMLSAMFIVHTVPLQSIHINKMLLHFLRRIEYFSLFFIFYSSVKNLKQIKIYTAILLLAVVGVVIYGFGQKYLYWPAFSTMNREFSKGWVLYLTKHARVLSTFGGHYDLAAFIMMILIMLWSLFFGVKKIITRVVLFLMIAGSFWTLILTASRTSFLSYLFGITVMFFFWVYRKGIRWSLPRWFAVVVLSIIVMLSFGDLSERFTKLLHINERVSGIKNLLLSPIGKPPGDKALFLENNPQAILAQITSKSDQPPTLSRPTDVYQDIPLLVPVATGSATVAAVPRTYSKTAFMYDLSTAIRFDALWPMAIAGFMRNPLLGSGYSTLNKIQPSDYTEAESTDNDYLRALGETGVLGFLTFYGTLFFILYLIWRNINALKEPVFFSLTVGLAGLLSGLLVNAAYIDVFVSSKVAFMFWAIVGFILAGINIAKAHESKMPPPPRIYDLYEFTNKVVRFIKSDKFILFIVLIAAFSIRLYKIKTPLADWHSWRQADTSAVTRNYVKHGINILYPTYDDLSNVASGRDNPKGLRLVEFPLYNLASIFIDKLFVGYTIEISGRLTSIFACLGSIVFLFLIVRKYRGRREAYFVSLLYAFLPYNIFFTRVILPEPFLVFTSLGMIFFIDRSIEEISSGKSLVKLMVLFILTYLFTAGSLLIKPTAAFLFLPIAYLWFKKLGLSPKSVLGLFGYVLVGLLPFIWWRWWISHYPEGIPAYTWLLNGDGIRFKGAFFYWLFAERLSKLILGYWGLPLVLLGILAPAKKDGWFFQWWGISMLLYVTVFATGNVRHDYYQIITIPIIVIFMGRGITFLLKFSRDHISRTSSILLIGMMLIFSGMFGWRQVRDFYNINHPEIVEAGSAVERRTPNKALVIAPYNGDTAFLYQTSRVGWPIMQDSIDNMIKKGAQFYVSTVFDDTTNRLIQEAFITDPTKKRFKIIEHTNKYVIIQLVPDNRLPR